MDPKRWQQIQTIFHAALDLPFGDRMEFVEKEAGGDTEIVSEVLSLLEADESTSPLDQTPAEAFDANSPGGEMFSAGQDHQPGDQIGPYVLGKPVGEGGFGEVSLAEQLEPVRRSVAIKILKAGMDSKSVVQRFEAERQALAVMDHPGFAQYVHQGSVRAWLGDLSSMMPGAGYKLYLGNAQNSGGEFVYPEMPGVAKSKPVVLLTNDPAASETEQGKAAATPNWAYDHRSYQYNMTLTEEFDLGEEARISAGDWVAAFVGEEVRGFTQVKSVPALDGNFAFLMIHGNELDGEDVAIQVFDASEGDIYEVTGTVSFEADAVNGSVGAPVQLAGTKVGAVEDAQDTNGAPTAFRLEQNSPNLFNPVTMIRYDVRKRGPVTVEVFDVSGRRVATIVDQVQKEGRYEVLWDAEKVASGVYFYKMSAGDFEDVRKMTLVR